MKILNTIYHIMFYLKYFALFYLTVIPMFTLPYWCNTDDLKKGTNCEEHIYPNSGMQKIKSLYALSINIIAFGILLSLTVLRIFLKKQTKSAIVRETLIILLNISCILDCLLVLLYVTPSTYVTKYFRIIILVVYM